MLRDGETCAPAERAPLPASLERLRAGRSERNSAGQLERAASSSNVCFFVGCCHSSGCVLASYACVQQGEHARGLHAGSCG